MVTEIAQRSEQLAHDLRVYGLDTRAHQRAPLDDNLFFVNVESKQIRPWVGVAVTQIAGDRKHRQAVINVTEHARTVTQSYAVHKAPRAQNLSSRLLASFPLFIPNARLVTYTVDRERRHQLDVTVRVEAPKATNSLLVGFDEIRQFVAALPKRASSVDEAHRLLRPDGLSRHTLRQGEWFFDPVLSPEERRDVERRADRAIPDKPLESGSSHRATVLTFSHQNSNRSYAIGTVTDGRVKHHRPLIPRAGIA